MKIDTQRFCNALGAELKSRFIHAKDPKTHDRLRLHQLAEMAETTDTTLRTLFRGGADNCQGTIRPRVDLCLVLRVCRVFGVHIIDIMHAAKMKMEGGK